MYALQTDAAVSAEEYLRQEREAQTKSEFLCGTMIAMAGASREHNEVATSLIVAIGSQLRHSSCRIYGSDMRVRIQEDSYCYPDLTIVCGEPRFADQRGDILLDPLVVIEILSPTTEPLDRGEKFRSYQGTASIQEIVFVSPNRRRIERYERQERGLWLYEALEEEGAALTLSACDVRVPLSEIYERVAF